MDMQLSMHFMLGELVASETAARLGIDNTPSPEIIANLERLCSYLESIRTAISAPISISSGYRCPELNKAVGGVPTSAHQYGRAADIHNLHMDSTEFTAYIAANCPGFDQVIDEHSGTATWTHVGIAPVGETPRAMVLKALELNGSMVYSSE